MATAKIAEVKDAKIKCMIWGDSGSGKSRFGLTSPEPLVIDTEDSTTLYAKEFRFHVARIDSTNDTTKNAIQLTNTIITEIEKGEYPTVKTLVVDCFTDLLDEIEGVSARSYEKMIGKSVGELNQLQKTKWYAYRRDNYRKIIDRLKALPLNLVLVCRSKDVWGTSGGKTQPIGKTYDAHELTEWLMDVVIKIEKDEKENTKGIVTKSRLGYLPRVIDINKGYINIVEALEKTNTKTSATAKENKRVIDEETGEILKD